MNLSDRELSGLSLSSFPAFDATTNHGVSAWMFSSPATLTAPRFFAHDSTFR
jgi:hypothetical protein